MVVRRAHGEWTMNEIITAQVRDMGKEVPENGNKVCSHYLRGHTESVVHQMGKTEEVSFDEDDYIARAGHTIATFLKAYARPMAERQRQSILSHPKYKELTAEEVQFQ